MSEIRWILAMSKLMTPRIESTFEAFYALRLPVENLTAPESVLKDRYNAIAYHWDPEKPSSGDRLSRCILVCDLAF